MKRNILTALLSLAIAFGLWIYVVVVVSPNSDNTYHGVTVVLQGEAELEERGLMITTRDMPTVSLRLEGSRSELQKLNSSNISITVDVSKIAGPGEHKLPVNPNNLRLPGDVSYSAITVASRKPDYIKLVVQDRVEDSIPVQVYPENVPQGYDTDPQNYELSYKEISVSGPADQIENLKEARVYVDLAGKSGTVTAQLPFILYDKQGNPVDTEMITVLNEIDTIELTLHMLRKIQIQLAVELIPGGGATEETCKVILDPETIEVSGTEAGLEKLQQPFAVGTIPLGDVLKDGPKVFALQLPPDIRNESDITQVIVNLSFPELEMTTLQITQFTAVNEPEGTKAKFLTEMLEVQFRGPKALVDALKPEHVTVTADFANIQDDMIVPVEITLSAEYAQIGAVGTYTVPAVLE